MLQCILRLSLTLGVPGTQCLRMYEVAHVKTQMSKKFSRKQKKQALLKLKKVMQ
jgi:hypothetical protein